MRIVLAFAVALALFVVGAAVAVFVFLRPSSSASGPSSLTAPADVQALAAPRLSDVDALAGAVVPSCPSRRGTPNAPSPAIGTVIASWRETVSVHVECMFESPPGSGSATGGGFDDYGTPTSLDGAWSDFGMSGWHVDTCTRPGSVTCVDYGVFVPDPSYVQIDAYRRFPSGDGWAHVNVLMRR